MVRRDPGECHLQRWCSAILMARPMGSQRLVNRSPTEALAPREPGGRRSRRLTTVKFEDHRPETCKYLGPVSQQQAHFAVEGGHVEGFRKNCAGALEDVLHLAGGITLGTEHKDWKHGAQLGLPQLGQ